MEGSSTQPENELPRKSNLGIWGTCDSNAAEGEERQWSRRGEKPRGFWVLNSPKNQRPFPMFPFHHRLVSLVRSQPVLVQRSICPSPLSINHVGDCSWSVYGDFKRYYRSSSQVLFSLKNKLITIQHQRAVLLVINWSS